MDSALVLITLAGIFAPQCTCEQPASLSISYSVQSHGADHVIRWGDTVTVRARIAAESGLLERATFAVSWQCDHDELCHVLDAQPRLFDLNGTDEAHLNITVLTTFIGYAQLEVAHASQISSEGRNIMSSTATSSEPLKLAILRSAASVQTTIVFTASVAIFVVVSTFMMGTQLHWGVIVESVKRPLGPAIGFACQFGLMPLISYTWASTILVGYPSLQFGYFVTGCAPAGAASNFWTLLLDGNLDLSVTMTFFSNFAALAMMPLWLYTLGRTFFGGDIALPFGPIAVSLAALLVPASLGMLVGRCWPETVPKFRRAVKVFIVVVLLFIVVFSCCVNWYIFLLMRWYTLTAGLALPWTGYATSYLVARYLARRNARDSRTIAIETGIQNNSIALMMCQMSLPAPASDLTLVMPICVFMFTGLPMWIWLLVRTVRKRCFGYVDPDVPEEKVDLKQVNKGAVSQEHEQSHEKDTQAVTTPRHVSD